MVLVMTEDHSQQHGYKSIISIQAPHPLLLPQHSFNYLSIVSVLVCV